jgi:hypothetical protein
MKPSGRWLPFTACADYDVRHVAFSWQARFTIVRGIAWLNVVDAYGNGTGRMDGRAWGVVPFMRARGEDIEVGQVARYLSELPWTPYAIVANPHLEWRQSGESSVHVATGTGASRVEVRLDFNPNGDIIAASMPGRPRRVRRASVETPWRGAFDDYATFGGVRLPRRGEVRWELPESSFTYWRCRIKRADVS